MASSLENGVMNTSDSSNGSARAMFYKKPIKKDNCRLDVDCIDTPQEVRRQRLLQFQKQSRDSAFNAARGILEEAFNSEEDEYEDEMEIDENEKGKHRNRRRQKYYANQLMMSEWMLEVPQDILQNWTMVPCPEGRRTLVVACKGITKAYNKRGTRLGKFHSALPGGNPSQHRNRCTILDCIWMKQQKTYYVLDVLAWSNQGLLDCDTECRFFWLKSQLSDIEALQERGTHANTFPILSLPNIGCDADISSAISNLPELPRLDGLLFYHKHTQYSKGRTPLVTWLKTFMLPEILGISVPPPYDEKPDGYIDLRHYILENKAKKRNVTQQHRMEIANDEH